MQFTQLSGELYFYSDGPTSATATLYYLLPEGSPSQGPSITFDQAWSPLTGTYIFLETTLTPGTEGTFMKLAWAFITDPSRPNTRFVWFSGQQTSTLSGTVLQMVPSGGQILIAFQANFKFQNIVVVINRRTQIAPNTNNDGFTLTQTASGQIVVTGAGNVPVGTGSAALNIPFTGSLSGCLQFPLTAAVADQVTLDIGLRYYYAAPINPKFPNQPGNFRLQSLRYPLFNAPATLYANLDVLAPLTPTRTFFAFNGADAGQSGTAAAILSCFNSILGYAFNLLPQSGSKLVFTVNQGFSQQTTQDIYTLVPSGLFDLQSTQTGSVTQSLMCGLSGVEYIPLTGTTNTVQFTPGQAAFATGFFPGKDPGYITLQPVNMPTTAFASLTSNVANAPLQYFAQPDQSVLYNLSSTFPTVTIPALGPVPVEAATINWPPPGNTLFPLLPYSGLATQALAPFQQLESQIASPQRRLALSLSGPPSPIIPTPPVLGPSVTPQGLLVQYQEGETQWDSVVLAQMTKAVGGQQFKMTGITNQLLAAFESNKLFLVISNPTSIAGTLVTGNDEILIGSDQAEAWTFDLNLAKWSRGDVVADNTIFIVKFSDLSVAALAAQPDTSWAFPSTFNQSAGEVSNAIASIIKAAATSNDSDFDTFNQIVTDPNWNGVLILNATAPLTSLPAQLAGLAAGIDPGKFYAHHVGINASQIMVQNPLAIANSSIFGLINYQGEPLTQSKADYQFAVQQLKVLFLNSSVAGFSSKIQLQINQLFSEPSNLPEGSDNIIEMYGVYQKHVVNGVEQDSYAFQTATGSDLIFNMTSQVLNVVEISQGQFVTITSQSSKTLNKSQFAFWGVLDFKALPGFDVFSFGRELNAPDPQGLSFSKLAIDMSFDPEDTSGPDGGPVVSFAFDASDITFDLAASKARTGSFFSHFPLTLAGLTQAKEGVTPSTLGYMGVQTPLNQSLVSYPWYSLNFNLNLGTPGALVAQVGFVASLTAGWNPSANQYAVFTGLKLPGSSGAKREISIEGIFNITFKTLQILATPAKDSYILILYGIAFSFLSFKFPPSGQVNFVLFGNPDSSTDTNLGWYAAYAKTGTGGGGGKDSQQATLAGAPPAALLDSPSAYTPEGGLQ